MDRREMQDFEERVRINRERLREKRRLADTVGGLAVLSFGCLGLLTLIGIFLLIWSALWKVWTS